MGTTIYNSDLTKALVDAVKIQTSRDPVPNQIADKVVPTVETNPFLLRINNVATGNTSTGTSGSIIIYTTPTDKDFFLTSYTYQIAKDVACDMASGTKVMTATGEMGDTLQLVGTPVYTLTAESKIVSVSLSRPIKLKRGTNIVVDGTFAAGTCFRTGRVTGFTVENVNA